MKCLEKSAGYTNVLDLIKHKSETEVRRQLLQDNLPVDKLEKLANLASELAKLCKIDDTQDIIKLFLPSETKMTTVHSYDFLTGTFISPKLTFIENDIEFPQLWPQHIIDFYFSVSILQLKLVKYQSLS